MNTLHICSLGDLHLGHRKNTAAEIIANLRIAFADNAETAALDIIFFCGDVFDDLLNLSDSDVWEINGWVTEILWLCKKHDIAIRIVEGTSSHERRQSEMFPSINEAARIGADLKYVKTIDIEYIERYGITVLYVPDEMDDNADKILSQVKALLRARGLTQVDFAVMHGAFEYQLPAHVHGLKHDSEAYLALVRHLIFIGHIHTFYRRGRIVPQGSFDRLAQGEEEPKGHVRVIISDDHCDLVFVENKGAKIFKTIRCNAMSLEDTIAKIDREVEGLPAGSQLRVESGADNPIFENMNVLIMRHPLFAWSKLIPKTEVEEAFDYSEEEFLYVPITITEENIERLVMERLPNLLPSSELLTIAQAMLKEVI